MTNHWNSANYLSLSTQKRDGSWVDTPVWFASAEDGVIYCFSEGKAGKVKRIRNFSAVRINPCSVTGKLHGQWQGAQATLIASDEDENKAYKALLKTYGWQLRILDFFSSMAGKIDKRVFIQLILD